jgi:hypothetical protein
MSDDVTNTPNAGQTVDLQHMASSADVTNMTILPLNCSLWAGMDLDCITEMNRIQLKYAVAVSKATSDAYQAILTEFDKHRRVKTT